MTYTEKVGLRPPAPATELYGITRATFDTYRRPGEEWGNRADHQHIANRYLRARYGNHV